MYDATAGACLTGDAPAPKRIPFGPRWWERLNHLDVTGNRVGLHSALGYRACAKRDCLSEGVHLSGGVNP